MSDNSSSTYIIVTEENIMNCEVIPYCETRAQALEGREGPADGFALNPESPEQPPPGCAVLLHAVQAARGCAVSPHSRSRSVWLRVRRTEVRSCERLCG